MKKIIKFYKYYFLILCFFAGFGLIITYFENEDASALLGGIIMLFIPMIYVASKNSKTTNKNDIFCPICNQKIEIDDGYFGKYQGKSVCKYCSDKIPKIQDSQNNNYNKNLNVAINSLTEAANILNEIVMESKTAETEKYLIDNTNISEIISGDYLIDEKGNVIGRADGKSIEYSDVPNLIGIGYLNSCKKEGITPEIYIDKCPKCGKDKPNYMPHCLECHTTPPKIEYSEEYTKFLKEFATVLMLKQFLKPKQYTNKNDIPVYFSWEYNVSNIDNFIKEMLNNNLLRKITFYEYLNLLKATELKDILKNSNLDVKGKKELLIQRIIDNNIEIKEFENIDNYFIVSDKGKKEYDKNFEFVKIHRLKSIGGTIEKYYELRKKYPESKGYSFADIYFMINEEFNSFDIGTDIYYNLIKLYFEENNFGKAIKFCIKCLVRDCCGGVTFLSLDPEEFKDMLKLEERNFDNTKRTFKYLTQLKEYYKRDFLIEEYKNLNFCCIVCSIENIENVVNCVLNNDLVELENVLSTLKFEKLSKLKRNKKIIIDYNQLEIKNMVDNAFKKLNDNQSR